jgi:hypothetical protein
MAILTLAKEGNASICNEARSIRSEEPLNRVTGERSGNDPVSFLRTWHLADGD